MKHIEWPRHPYKVMPKHIWRWRWTREMPMKWRITRAARKVLGDVE